MGVTNLDVFDGGALNAVDLVIAAENSMDVRVKAGMSKVAGVERELLNDSVHTCTADPAAPTSVSGYLVRDTATDVIEVLVDEVILDGGDVPYTFDDDAYEALAYLFELTVPAAATDITGENITVRRIVPLPA